jgi:hypothetical protein
MKKNIKIFTVTYLVFLFLITITSCVGDCGPFPNKFNVTSFNWNVSNVEFTDTYYTSADVTNNEVNYANFGIIITAEIEEYYSNTINFGLTDKMYACSPIPPTTNDKITNIEVFVNQDFNADYLAESNMVEKFEVGFVNENGDFNTMNLADSIQVNLNVRREIILLLNDAPLENGNFTFTVKITMEGKTLDYFEFTTNPMTITNN